MYHLSLIISEIYNKFLPLAEQNGIQLDLDVVDSTVIAKELSGIQEDVEKALSETISRSDKGKISIKVNRQEIIISDTGTTLSHALCSLLSSKYVDVKSRVGFGTTIRINLERLKNPENRDEVTTNDTN